MRLLAAHPAPDGYGADLMLLAALRDLRARGADVTVAVPSHGPLVARLAEADLRVVRQPFPVLRKALLRPAALVQLVARAPGDVFRLARLLRAEAPDVLYVNTLTLPHWIVAARLTRTPVVCHVRESEDQLPAWLQRSLTAPLLLCDRAIANSHHTAHHVLRWWPRLAGRLEVVHNGFHFGPPPAPGRRAPARELLVVGRLNPRKGQDVALRAVRRVHDAGWPVRLRVVGTPFPGYEWFEADLRRSASELGIADHVTFAGYRDDIPACHARADIVLVPSRVEPFGNVAVEALAAARPLVASRVGGLREIVDHGRTGLLVAPDDDEALAGAVIELLADPGRARAMAQHGCREVRSRFCTDAYADGVERVLQAASAGRASRRRTGP